MSTITNCAAPAAGISTGGAGKGDIAMVDLAAMWLATKVAASKVRDPRNSDEARSDDLCRLARALHPGQRTGNYDLRADFGTLALRNLNPAAVRSARLDMEAIYSSTTVARTMTTVRGFVLWLVDRGDIAGDATWISALHAEREEHDPLEELLTTKNVEAMLDAARTPSGRDWSAWAVRDVALLSLLAGTGVRASDACNLRVRNLHQGAPGQEGRLTVEANNRTRNVPVPTDVIAALDAYIAERSVDLPIDPGSPLFVRRDGAGVDRSFVQRLVRRCANEAEVKLPASAAAHALRHYHGVQLAAGGATAAQIAARLGHADGRMASSYARAAAAMLAGEEQADD